MIPLRTLLLILAAGLFACGAEPEPLANAGKLGLQARTVDDLLALDPEEFDVGTAALVFSEDLNPATDLEGLQNSLDILAIWLRDRITPEMSTADQLGALIGLLADERGYRATDEALAPGAHDLALMMYSKQGNCMGLASLYLALAERVGIDLQPILSPRHIYTVLHTPEVTWYLDPTIPQASAQGQPGWPWYFSEEQKNLEIYARALTAEQLLAQMLVSHTAALRARGGSDVSEEAERRCVQLLREAAGRHPMAPNVLHALADSLGALSVRTGEDFFGERREILDRARKLDPTNADLFLASARMEIEAEDWPVAERWARRAVDLEPNMPVHRMLLAQALKGRAQFVEAAKTVHRARELEWSQVHPVRRELAGRYGQDPQVLDIEALFLLARIYLAQATARQEQASHGEIKAQAEAHEFHHEVMLSLRLGSISTGLASYLQDGKFAENLSPVELFADDELPIYLESEVYQQMKSEFLDRVASDPPGTAVQ